MENLDLFDKYINNELSQKEKEEFDARLQKDKEFATEFKIYSLAIDGILREAEQDNKDFEVAMKHISKDNLLEIIVKKEEKSPVTTGPIAIAAEIATEIPAAAKPAAAKESKFKKWLLWQSVGVAALLGFAVIYIVIASNESAILKTDSSSLSYNKSENVKYLDKIDNTIYTLYSLSQESTRGENLRNVYTLGEEELRAQLPELENNLWNQKDDEDIVIQGSDLVMVYIKLHERNKAKTLLSELIAKFKDNEDYAPDVENWQTILQLLQQ